MCTGKTQNWFVHPRCQGSGTSLMHTWVFLPMRLFLRCQAGCHATHHWNHIFVIVVSLFSFLWVTRRASALFAALWQYESTHCRAALCSLHALVSVLALGTGKNPFRSLCYPSLLKSQSALYESQLLEAWEVQSYPFCLYGKTWRCFHHYF